jgi:hypothetical protein
VVLGKYGKLHLVTQALRKASEGSITANNARQHYTELARAWEAMQENDSRKLAMPALLLTEKIFHNQSVVE